MIQLPFSDIVDSLAAKTPTPGGGAAAAMSGCLGASLFLMVTRFARGKKANVDRDAELAQAEEALAGHLDQLKPMAERDCKSFDLVSAAFKMPKETTEEKAVRSKAIQEAMVGAMVVPDEALRMMRDVFAAMDDVVGCVPNTIASDLGTGAALLMAAAEGVFLNVRINADSLKDRELAEGTMARARAVRDEIHERQARIAAAVEKLLA